MNTPTQILPQQLNNTIPAVLISFDGGWASQYSEAYAYMHAENMNATAYVTTSVLNGAGYLTDAQLQEMDGGGWDIANHTVNHHHNYDMTQAEEEAEFTGCRNYLNALGLTRASRHVAYPYGDYDAETQAAMEATAMLSGRLAAGETTEYVADLDWYQLPVLELRNATTLAQAKAFLNDACCHGRIAHLFTHELVAAGPTTYQWLISDFQALIDYILYKNMVSLTISQLYALNSGPLVYSNPWYGG